MRARRHAAGALAVAVSVGAWSLTGLPDVSNAAEVAQRFSFSAEPLGPADAPGDPKVRPVAPAYSRISGWISSVGAGVALFDADGTTVSDDVCLVDPRHDTVTVSPAPGTAERYAAFTLAAPERKPYEAPMGCLPADLNEDGWQDVVVYYWGRSPALFLRLPKVGPSAAAYQYRSLAAEPEVWNTNAATMGDYDGDGRLDLVFGNYFPEGARVLDPTGNHGDVIMNDSMSNASNGGRDRLFRGLGDGRFEEVGNAFAAGVANGWTLAMGTQDLDSDGRPDLYIANDFGPDKLLMNVSSPGRIAFNETKGTRHLTTPKSKVVGSDSFKGMGVAFADLNRDQAPDILVSNITEPYALQESNFAFMSKPGGMHGGHAPFDDRSEELGLSRTGWTWDVKAADFDNDGDDEIMHATGFVRGRVNRWAQLQEAAMSNDLILGHPTLWPNFKPGDDLSGRDVNSFFARDGKDPNGRYTDVAAAAGVGTDAVSRAFAVGDVDDDGRLDFAVANQWGRSVLFRNTGPSAPFVGLRLRLPAGGCVTAQSSTAQPGTAQPGTAQPDTAQPGENRTRPAIGATATLKLPDGTSRTRQLYPANGHNGVSAPDLMFGLGEHATAEPFALTLSWRDACGVARTTSTSITPGWHQVLLTGDGRAVEIR
ncbi:Repeat domain-containing protein [Sinosporangium album]|uniref:Repeat domain-containing protein n=1 Tax=Sinosporangium album TaxID=504805 RepID=A0A1G8F2Q5_9ACTN|nr:VCBS repeat-containing protein [Sinosporangium album]SDH76425.1 Repeat domain-containing protein [Sinosporangium album]